MSAVDDLRKSGDTLQSTAGRMAEFIRNFDDAFVETVPYEVRMAALEAESAVGDWSKARIAEQGGLRCTTCGKTAAACECEEGAVKVALSEN